MFCRHFNKTVNSPLVLPEREIFMANSTLLVGFLYAKCLHGIIPCEARWQLAKASLQSQHMCAVRELHMVLAACKLGKIAPYFFLFMNISLGVSP